MSTYNVWKNSRKSLRNASRDRRIESKHISTLSTLLRASLCFRSMLAFLLSFRSLLFTCSPPWGRKGPCHHPVPGMGMEPVPSTQRRAGPVKPIIGHISHPRNPEYVHSRAHIVRYSVLHVLRGRMAPCPENGVLWCGHWPIDQCWARPAEVTQWGLGGWASFVEWARHY